MKGMLWDPIELRIEVEQIFASLTPPAWQWDMSPKIIQSYRHAEYYQRNKRWENLRSSRNAKTMRNNPAGREHMNALQRIRAHASYSRLAEDEKRLEKHRARCRRARAAYRLRQP